MKKLLVLVAAAAASLVISGFAQAGCWATVGLTPLPGPGQSAGTPWVANIRILQHGTTPMSGARPVVRIRNAAGKLFAFKAKPTARTGSYRAQVVFPAAGRYSVAVYDGFPIKACAKVQSFGSFVIGGV